MADDAQHPSHGTLLDALSELSSRRVVLFGGKGGVGKTTLSTAAALHFARTRSTILFTTDPASNLRDLLGPSPALRIEELDASALYTRFLATNLDSFLEIGDRGTYLDREELRRLFELSIPGIDELMAWMRIGELAEENPDALIVVNTAPTGHTLRMLSSSGHFRQLARALDAMAEKHRVLVQQFTRRSVRDAIDAFIDDFASVALQRGQLLADPARAAFVPVTLAEPLVLEQTLSLIAEVCDGAGLQVPFVVLNRARDAVPSALEPWRVVIAPRSCAPLDTTERIAEWSTGTSAPAPAPAAEDATHRASRQPQFLEPLPLMFFAGKGGVGKTSCSASVALQLALRHPDRQYRALSVDPAHSLRDLFERMQVPANLIVETIDTRAKWRRFRDAFGDRIEEAVGALTPRGVSIAHDTEAMLQLIEIAPPGADELFAIVRIADLSSDPGIDGLIIDTAPTGHFLRLLDLPQQAGEWVREFMRILLRYRDLLPPGSLGEELVRASRALKDLELALRSERTAVVVVTRPERIVLAETIRLAANVRARGIRDGGTIANYLTPENGDACDQSMRTHELRALESLSDPILIERRERPPMSLEELVTLVPMA